MMKKCHCVVSYQALYKRYVLESAMVKNGFDPLAMLWDTGVCNSVIYSNLLRDIKNVDKRQLDELEKLLKYGKKDIANFKYICNSFGVVSGKDIMGILYCIHNVYINHLYLENFYFYILPANEKRTRGLIGADFISCCKRHCEAASNEIFTQFDELYERNNKNLYKDYNQVYNLNFLENATSSLQQSIDYDKANEVNAFL